MQNSGGTGYFYMTRDSVTYPNTTLYFSYDGVNAYTNLTEDSTYSVTYGVAFNLMVAASAKVKITL